MNSSRPSGHRRASVDAVVLPALFLGLILSSAGCRDGDAGVDDPLASATPWTLSDESARVVAVERVLRPTDHDPPVLNSVRDLAIAGDTIALVDDNDWITFLNPELELIRRWGDEGSESGEYLRPYAVAALDDGWIVADNGNSRYTRLDRAGRVVETGRLPPLVGQGTATIDGELLLPLTDSSHYLIRATPEGWEGWGARLRPPDPVPPIVGTPTNFQKDFVVRIGDRIWVIDGETLEFLAYRPDGERVERRSLPTELAGPLLEGTGIELVELSGRQVPSYRPAIGQIAGHDGTGRILFINPRFDGGLDFIGAIVDTRRGTILPLRTDLPHSEWRGGEGITAVEFLDGERLLVATQGSALILLELEVPG